MASETEIINNGLIRVGANTITNRTDGSDNAVTANIIYDQHRNKLLRRHTWNFATKRVKLAQSSNTPVYEFQFQYPIPSDFLRLISVSNNDAGTGRIRYKMEQHTADTRVIITSASHMWLRYAAKITDANQFDDLFQSVLSLSLAKVFAIKIAQSNTLFRDVQDEFKSEIRQARSVDSQEDFPDQFPDGSWTEVRNTGVDGTSQSFTN